MKDWRIEEPDNLFPAPRDAAWYLAGLAGFWGGLGVCGIAVAAAAPSLAVTAIVVLVGVSLLVTMRAVGKLEGRITGGLSDRGLLGIPVSGFR